MLLQDYVSLNSHEMKILANVKEKINDIDILTSDLEYSPEQALYKMKMREAYMWLQQALLVNGKNKKGGRQIAPPLQNRCGI